MQRKRGNRTREPSPSPAPARTPDTTAAEGGVLDLQRWAGNRRVAAMLNPGPTLSRQAARAPAVTPAPGVAPTTDPDFDKTTFVHDGSRFDTVVKPVGPVPALGSVVVTLKVHIDFKDFTRADRRREPFRSHRFTRAQFADFRWTAAEKAAFGSDFQSSVSTAWSRKHELVTQDPTVPEHRATVDVKVDLVDDAGAAHTTVSALKVPKGKAGEKAPPRFRSSVRGDRAQLESRDASETETSKVRNRPFIRQVPGFANDSSEVTPDMATAISGCVTAIKAKGLRPGESTAADGSKHDLHLVVVGRATQVGSGRHNEKLARARAEAVLALLDADLGFGERGHAVAAGEKNTTDDPSFRRADVVVNDHGEGALTEVTQNTVAHEAGHMFGLDDEYVEQEGEGSDKKFIGDKPSHYGDVEAQLGTDAAEELVDQDSGSIMSVGSSVKRGHYVPFLQDVEAATRKDWTVG